jgi:hypothetical protein
LPTPLPGTGRKLGDPEYCRLAPARMTGTRQPIDWENEIGMSKRRQFISLGAGLVRFCRLTSGIGAQAASRAAAFIKNIGDKLVAAINGPGSTQDIPRTGAVC